ncbi:MAG TPA: hypothetical protein P5544_14810 [Candidatus Nanopelagicales bacterium]|jgi:hypothetical protein|nr:hypothetical protein [Candidatus Nanopelagicales bacterium]
MSTDSHDEPARPGAKADSGKDSLGARMVDTLPSGNTKGPDRRERVRGFLRRSLTQDNIGLTKEAVGLLAAAFALAAAGLGVLGYFLNAKSNEADALRSDKLQLQSELGTLREQISGLEGRNNELRDAATRADREIAELRAQLPAAAPVGPDVPPIRKAGTLTLAAGGDSIDLNSTDSNFGAQAGRRFEPDVLWYTEQGLTAWRIGGQGMSRVRLAEPASYGPCSVATGWAPIPWEGVVDPSELSDGQTCFRLASGRLATIHPVSFDDGKVTLQITVWQLP